MPVTKRATAVAKIGKINLKDWVIDPVPDLRFIDQKAYAQLVAKAMDRRIQYVKRLEKSLVAQKAGLAKNLGMK